MVLRLIAQSAREDDEPPPPLADHPVGDNDYLCIELDGWDNHILEDTPASVSASATSLAELQTVVTGFSIGQRSKWGTSLSNSYFENSTTGALNLFTFRELIATRCKRLKSETIFMMMDLYNSILIL
ncbi:hypothetical protein L1887_02449 [Cichorium endivia]|nr:hypothetical protein L1887_02449 [Cichorium endivia]